MLVEGLLVGSLPSIRYRHLALACQLRRASRRHLLHPFVPKNCRCSRCHRRRNIWSQVVRLRRCYLFMVRDCQLMSPCSWCGCMLSRYRFVAVFALQEYCYLLSIHSFESGSFERSVKSTHILLVCSCVRDFHSESIDLASISLRILSFRSLTLVKVLGFTQAPPSIMS